MRLFFSFSLLFVAAACGSSEAVLDGSDLTVDEAEVSSGLGSAVPSISCQGSPAAGAGSFRHLKSRLTVALGSPRHRGIDLVATASAATQTVEGEISYGVNDKALEDEWVQLYACRAGAWTYLGPVLTDDEGRFSLGLTGASRLPVGLRDLFVSVWGDRTTARFVALVAPVGTPVAVSDIDGTLTASEDAFPNSLLSGSAVAQQTGAASALSTLAGRGYPIVYVTARGRYFSTATRAWLNANGFPRGPMRLAKALVTLPGAPTVDLKVAAISGLGLPAMIGIGNRGTDAEAFGHVGIPATQTYLKLPEYASEARPYLDAGKAIGFSSYAAIAAIFSGL